MSGFLLDANVISELARRKPEARVTAWVEATDETLLHLSVLTLGELRKGIVSLPNASRRMALGAWLDGELRDTALATAFCPLMKLWLTAGGGLRRERKRGCAVCR